MDKAFEYWNADNKGSWNEGSIFLGHRMLWNTPESRLEYLPYISYSANQTLVITIDARLDNRQILADQLNMLDIPLENITDSKLILAAYQKWDTECPKYLLGDFVFVIWDKNKQQLFCARDHIGIKPFYYYLNDDLFIFSNDIRGLIAHPEVKKKYNDRSMAMFLSGNFGFYDKKHTLFLEIHKLEAATSITITQDNSLKSIYWSIENIPAVQYNTYEEYVEKLRELLLDAVQVRLRTSYPVASHLSGGLDSSAIAVLAARGLKKRDHILYAFNWVETPIEKKDSGYPEWGFATHLSELENIDQKHVKLTPEYIAKMYDKVNISQDDITYFWGEYLVRDEAKKYGVRTILSGWGGDDLISYDGYAYLSGLFYSGHIIKAMKKIASFYKYNKKKYIYLRTIKKSLREIIYPFFYKKMYGLYKEKKYNIDMFEFAQDQFASFGRNQFFPKLKFCPGVHEEQKALFENGHILQRIEYWATSAFEKKIEYSYPLLDKRIVEFALSIPEDLFAYKEGHQRYFFRSVISDFLPKNIAWAAKNAEPEYAKTRVTLWHQALKIWIENNENIQKNKNGYIERMKIIKRIKMYLLNQENKVEDNIDQSAIVSSILLANLKN